MSRSDCTFSLSSSDTESDEEFRDPEMMVLQGDKTPEEALLQRKGCFRDLQVFRYNLYSEEFNIEGFIPLLYWEEELRKNCQEQIALREKANNNPKLWGNCISYEKELARIVQSSWFLTRRWWYAYGWLAGNSGALSRGLKSWRSNTSWYMHPILVEDCQARGGCCGRDCGCCLSSEREKSSAGLLGVGHCTLKCGCCLKSRGFDLNQETESAYVRCFSFENEMEEGDFDEVNPYKHRILLAALLGLSVKDD